MQWDSERHIITNEMIKKVENSLNIEFPKDFVLAIKMYDGSYPVPNIITVSGENEIVNNFVSFWEEDESYILDVLNDTEGLGDGLIPIAEDPFGNLFCYDFLNLKEKIVFWNHEQCKKNSVICNNFTEFIGMLHD